MAALASSGSWLTLISGVAAREPSGGGEGLLFPFAGVLSLWRQHRREQWREVQASGKCVLAGVRVTGVCMCTHLGVHV